MPILNRHYSRYHPTSFPIPRSPNIVSSSQPTQQSKTRSSLQMEVMLTSSLSLGFRVRTVDHVAEYFFEVTFKRMHLLKLGNEVLQEHLPRLLERLNSLHKSKTLHSTDEAERKARALREIEADRDLVKDRVERERVAREARELLRKQREEEEAKLALESAAGPKSDAIDPSHTSEPKVELESDDDEDEEWHPSYVGQGRKLGD
ncbi:hypothetical protein BCR39DRAFT_529779 [Naematelia encephala]|uniref:Uncharacterized protein n=1 Tax=Naematelia encephala TaxID=71784 RepID=A0A1Y2B792_9TREE|nr:hypothetical protein BCR39DRAFT_529779 [Naematelia encephala]